ncbi:protein GrpE [Noviherbaspirillum autotrophicum]|uniref:Protein GrpE n=2 Tax=Noviherbaspirillum autotrophicum TaxID=709839 RepID=A0A0C1YMH8_9BURK|nr:nucleotide exchange factor GrpE [Noviherbaspirillum autotrophicum]KIF81752.1 protein GrpE [Noviherbaspirillum autotrophicum]
MQDQEKMQDQVDQAQAQQAQEQTAQPQAEQQKTEQPKQGDTEGGAQPSSGSSWEEKLAAAEAKAAEMQDAYLRAKADTENIRRRAQDDIAKAHKFAIENFAEALVPVKDSLEMALKLDTPSVESLKEGVEMTLKQLSTAFERNRLLEINPTPGEKLDPMKHQAISMVPAQQEANTIVNVLQKGYTIADRLLRPALVTVAQ